MDFYSKSELGGTITTYRAEGSEGAVISFTIVERKYRDDLHAIAIFSDVFVQRDSAYCGISKDCFLTNLEVLCVCDDESICEAAKVAMSLVNS